MTHELTWKAEDIIHAVQGQCLHEQNWIARGVSIDSRSINPGDVFIALKERVHDGHNHVLAAFEAGAVAAIVARQVHTPSHAPLILVPDTFKALEDLGRAARKRSMAHVITASAGTECKDMLCLMLNEIGETFDGENDRDDQVGIPLALAQLPETASYGVFKIDMNSVDRLEYVSHQIQPHIAFIATSTAEHPDDFLSMQTLLDGKAKIFSGMVASGVALLDRNSPQFPYLAAAAKAKGLKKIMSYGSSGKADARLIDYAETREGSSTIDADILGRKIRYSLGVSTLQTALHSVGALGAIAAAGGDIEACAGSLTHYRRSKKHAVIERVGFQEGGFMLIDKTGDIDLPNFRFTLRVLGQMQPALGGQRFLVLGDMPFALPHELTRDIIEAGIAAVYCCGPSTASLYETLPVSLRGFYARTGAQLAAHILKAIEAGDIVVATGARIGEITDALRSSEKSTGEPKRLAG